MSRIKKQLDKIKTIKGKTEIKNINSVETYNNSNSPTLEETRGIKRLALYLDYIVTNKKKIIITLRLNKQTPENNYIIKDYRFDLTKCELKLYFFPYNYNDSDEFVLYSTYLLGKIISNITDVEFMSDEKIYIHYKEILLMDEMSTQRMYIRLNEKEITEAMKHKINVNSMNSRYVPRVYLPDYYHLKTKDPLVFNYRYHLDSIDIEPNSSDILDAGKISDKKNYEYFFSIIVNEGTTSDILNGDVWLFTQKQKINVIDFEYVRKDQHLRIVDFQMKNYADRGIGQILYTNLEKTIKNTFGLKCITGFLSTIDDENKDRRNYFYSKLGFETIRNSIKKTI